MPELPGSKPVLAEAQVEDEVFARHAAADPATHRGRHGPDVRIARRLLAAATAPDQGD